MTSQEVVDFVHKHLNTVSLAHNCVWVPLSLKFVPSSTPKNIPQEDKLSDVCEKLLNRCVAPTSGGEGCDNMTVIIVQFNKPLSSAATTSTEQPAATAEEMRPK